MSKGAGYSPRRRAIFAALACATMAVPFGAAIPNTVVEAETPQAAVRWDDRAIAQLVAIVANADREGLNPQDYDVAALRKAVDGPQGASRDVLADAVALRLASDYLFGRVTDRSSMQWMIERSPYERTQLPERLRAALERGDLRDFYASLLPDNDRYRALRDALAEATDTATRDRIRVNMERWRWMPRGMAENHIYVNVPSYRLDVVEGGMTLSSYDVVVGARDTPTPLMVSPANSVVVNPSWYVPASIVKSSGLRPGRGNYRYKALPSGGYAVVQPPGPRNALGKIKFNLVNDQAIYLHDTPAKAAFKKDARALSHGCIRVSNIDQLAGELMAAEGGDRAALEDALAGTETQTLRLPRQWPVYLVYFTMDKDANGSLVSYDDPYDYDAAIIAQLDGHALSTGGGMTVASLRR
jgi:L,D-transpeptidase YcbB